MLNLGSFPRKRESSSGPGSPLSQGRAEWLALAEERRGFMRSKGALHSLQRGLELQIVQPVDRFDIDALLLAAVLDVERNRRARGTDGPDLAIKVRETA